MKYLAIIFSVFLFSCSSSNDDVPNTDKPNNDNAPNSNNPSNGGNPILTGRYKISFQAESNIGEKHFKAIYVLNKETPIVVNYDGNITPSGYITTNNIQDIHFYLEMTSGSCYLKNIKMKIEDLQTSQILYQTQSPLLDYIISPDMLTEQAFLNNLYGYPSQHFYPKNNYKFHFIYGSGYYQGSNYYPEYSYKPEILVNKPTRGSLRIVINDSNFKDYELSIPNAWSIRDYEIGSGMNEILSEKNVFNSREKKTYELILPGHLPKIAINLKGINVTATIYLMRKNGSTQTVNVTSTNNQIMTTNFNL